MLRKPTWMSQEQYGEVIKLHEQACKVCGATEDLTIDHIIPRWQAGKDELPNYQILCRSHNASKGRRDDHYWGRDFYFDRALAQENLFTSQRVYVFDKILDYAAWFTRPWSEIARRLYIIAGGPGCGKTIAMPTVGHALNFIMRRDLGSAARRVDKMLVLTKEQGLRDQIADDLTRDITRYNILPSAPRVRTVESYDLLTNQEIVDQADIWVSCVQMFFEQNQMAKRDLERVLALFPLICIDEPHWATEQVLKLVDAASMSLCFGFTGTPIDAQGHAMQRFTLLSLYTYDDAVEYDHSLKYLTDLPGFMPEIIEEIGVEEADVLEQGTTRLTTSIAPEHVKNFVAARTIGERVASYIYDCDQNAFHERAPHRSHTTTPDLFYPMHGIVYVDRVVIAKHLADFLNTKFQADHKLFPLARGWKAEVIYSATETPEGQRLRGPRMSPRHPWMRCYRNQGALDAQCARLLIVVGMGREGLNNPYCGVYGLTANVNSTIFVVQAPWGRTIRAVIQWQKTPEGRELHVAPARLDVPRIITHVAAQNMHMLQAGLSFILHMDDYLDEMPTIDDLIHDIVPPPDAHIAPEVAFTQAERLQIASAVGQARLDGRDINTADILQPWHNSPQAKRERMEAWIALLQDAPQDASLSLHHRDTLEPAYIVTRELPITNPTDEMLTRFLHREHPHLQTYLTDMDHNRAWMTTLYQERARQFHLGHVVSDTTLSALRRQFGTRLQTILGKNFIGDRNMLYRAVGIAMRQKLNVPREKQLKNGGEWDIAACHIMLTRDEVRRDILGFGVQWVMKQGLCPTLAAAFQVPMTPWDLEEDADAPDDQQDLA